MAARRPGDEHGKASVASVRRGIEFVEFFLQIGYQNLYLSYSYPRIL